MVVYRSLSESKSPQVSKTLLSILAVLNNVVVWMVSTRPSSSKYPNPFYNPLVTVTKESITICIIVMFHSFFNSLANSRYLSFFSLSFSFIKWPAGTAKSTILQVLFIIIIIIIIIVINNNNNNNNVLHMSAVFKYFYRILMVFKQIYLIHRTAPNRYYAFESELTWKLWQRRGTLHSPKLQHYWNLTITLFTNI